MQNFKGAKPVDNKLRPHQDERDEFLRAFDLAMRFLRPADTWSRASNASPLTSFFRIDGFQNIQSTATARRLPGFPSPVESAQRLPLPTCRTHTSGLSIAPQPPPRSACQPPLEAPPGHRVGGATPLQRPLQRLKNHLFQTRNLEA
jgi:hypothetical protein